MKKALILFIFLFSLLPAHSQQGQGAKSQAPRDVVPPATIIEKFNKEHPGMTPSWKADGTNFRADFVDPNTFKGCSILYDKDGNVIRRENEMENASYPQTINDYYIKHFPGEKFKTWTSLDNSGQKKYYIRRENEVVWFDKDGNYIRN
jgi:hypothetical protein